MDLKQGTKVIVKTHGTVATGKIVGIALLGFNSLNKNYSKIIKYI